MDSSLFRGIPVGQFLRIKQNYSVEKDFRVDAEDMYQRFTEGGYSHSCIRRAKKRAIECKCQDLLQPKKDPKQITPLELLLGMDHSGTRLNQFCINTGIYLPDLQCWEELWEKDRYLQLFGPKTYRTILPTLSTIEHPVAIG